MSSSSRRTWIEIARDRRYIPGGIGVVLLAEDVDRNSILTSEKIQRDYVVLLAEDVDRNWTWR